MRDERLVTVATFANPNEAYLFRGLLEQEGITSFIFDEHSAMMTPVFMVRVVVSATDYEKAVQLLKGEMES